MDGMDYFGRTAPAHIVAGLQAIDPTLGVVYMGAGAWCIGAWRFRWPLVQQANALESRIRRTQDTMSESTAKLLPLLRRGFRPIDTVFRTDGDLTWNDVDDIRRRDWLHRHPAAAAEYDRTKADELDGTTLREQQQHAARTYARDIMPEAVKRKRASVSVRVQGLRHSLTGATP